MRYLVLLAAVPLAACHLGHDADAKGVPGTGSGGSRSYAVTGFSAVAATGPDDVDVRVGSGFSVRAEGDAAVLDKLVIVRNGDTLEVRRQNGSWSWGGDKGAKVYITMPRIAAASVTGSGDMAIDHVDGSDFKVNATGSGDTAIGSVAVQSLTLSLTGSGGVTTGGTAKSLSVSVTGSGDVDAAKLTASGATVSVMGSGDVNAAVAGAATVNVMGSGDVTLTGGAKCTTSKMGSGTVTCS